MRFSALWLTSSPKNGNGQEITAPVIDAALLIMTLVKFELNEQMTACRSLRLWPHLTNWGMNYDVRTDVLTTPPPPTPP